MTPATKERIWTDEEFMALSGENDRYELVDGELVNMGNSGMEHGYLASNLTIFLGGYVLAHKLGVICDSSTAFTMKAGNKRAPNVSFITKERLQGIKRLPKGFFSGAPDLVVEIISPNNTFAELHGKMIEYFANECRLAWLIHPDEQSILVYRSPRPDRLLKITDNLDGEEIIPGFSMPISNLFMELDF